jgi:hypothetical protein
MEQMEQGRQWPYTCYSPVSYFFSTIPGMDDISPEEMRLAAYQVFYIKAYKLLISLKLKFCKKGDLI